RKFYECATSENNGSSAPETEVSIETEPLPIIEALPTEKPSNDEALSDAIAASALTLDQAHQLACNRGCTDQKTSFKDGYRKKGEDYYKQFGLIREPNPNQKARQKWFYFDTQTQS
ncbi:MAG: hypothetical protein ACKO96_01525, partial [Flammeovirgaceae bacterium]